MSYHNRPMWVIIGLTSNQPALDLELRCAIRNQTAIDSASKSQKCFSKSTQQFNHHTCAKEIFLVYFLFWSIKFYCSSIFPSLNKNSNIRRWYFMINLLIIDFKIHCIQVTSDTLRYVLSYYFGFSYRNWNLQWQQKFLLHNTKNTIFLFLFVNILINVCNEIRIQISENDLLWSIC